MKIKLDIDCTPKEARDFLGLPDVAPMQDRLLQALEERLKAGLSGQEAAELWKTWMPLATSFPGGAEGMESLRRFFWPGQDKTGGSPKDD
ncbi:MAG: DUF6489 family protein [Pseudomonadota bacterium]